MINNLQVIMNQIVELLDNIKVEDNVKVQVLLWLRIKNDWVTKQVDVLSAEV